MVNQISCYILIVPAFGIISTTVSANSNKSIFGYSPSSSLINLNLLSQQTICRKVKFFLEILLSTPLCKFIISLVKILVIYDNPQITKARSEYFKPCIKQFMRLRQNSLKFRNSNKFINSLNMKCFKQLRYTHTLSNVIDKNNYQSYLNMIKLNPYFVTGFTDGEGCFMVNIRPNSKLKIGYSIELVFKITLHLKDRALLEDLKIYFGVGTVTVRGSDSIQY